MSQGRRWLVVAALLAVGWLATPLPGPPLYDGVGFPDEPYRFVPPRGDLPAATSAEVRLKVTGGVNVGGLLANSAETGPQVSVFAPPRAFAVPGPRTTSDIRLRAKPVPPTDPPPGRLESNVYRLSLTSDAGPVTVRPDAQPPGITLRAVEAKGPLPVMHFRAAPGNTWRVLTTRRVGQDNFTSVAPGAGDYVLAPAPAPAQSSSDRRGLLVVVLLAATFLAAVPIVIRRMNTARVESGPEEQS